MGQFWVKTIALSGSILNDRQHTCGMKVLTNGGFKYEVQHGLRTGETLGTEF